MMVGRRCKQKGKFDTHVPSRLAGRALARSLLKRLGFIGPTLEAMMTLRQALSEDPEAVVRSRAAQSLGYLRDKEIGRPHARV